MKRWLEIAAAICLAQVEKLDRFVEKRETMARMYKDVLIATKCDWLRPQVTPSGDRNVYYAFVARFLRDDVKWREFRSKYIENGGDGIYAAWTLCYQEDSIEDVKRILRSNHLADRMVTESGICPIAERIQPQIMQFTTNQKDDEEMLRQAEALYKTIKYFS